MSFCSSSLEGSRWQNMFPKKKKKTEALEGQLCDLIFSFLTHLEGHVVDVDSTKTQHQNKKRVSRHGFCEARVALPHPRWGKFGRDTSDLFHSPPWNHWHHFAEHDWTTRSRDDEDQFIYLLTQKHSTEGRRAAAKLSLMQVDPEFTHATSHEHL